MEEVKENPSLPSNYVSLLQLRERWLQENERKLKENEEERPREQKLQEQKVQHTKLEENNDRESEVANAEVRQHGTHSKSRNRKGRRQFQRQKYNRAVLAKEKSMNADEVEDEAMVADPRSQRDEKKKEEREEKLQEQKVQRTKLEEKNDRESEVGKAEVRKHGTHPKSWNRNGSRQFQRQKYNRAVLAKEKSTNADEAEDETMVADPRSQRDQKKKEERSMENRGEGKNPRAENEEIKSASRAPENLVKEIREADCELGMRNGKKNVRARRIDHKKGQRSECESETGAMAETEQIFSHLSVSFEIDRGNNGRTRTSKETSHGRRNSRDDQNLRRRRVPEPRDVGMVWVRKDELSNDGSRLGFAESQGHG